MAELTVNFAPTRWQRRASPYVTRALHRWGRQLNREVIANDIRERAAGLSQEQKAVLSFLLIRHKLVLPKFVLQDPATIQHYHLRKLLSLKQVMALTTDYESLILRKVEGDKRPSQPAPFDEIIVGGGASSEVVGSENLAAFSKGGDPDEDAFAMVRFGGKTLLVAADGVGSSTTAAKASQLAVLAIVYLFKEGVEPLELFANVVRLGLQSTMVMAVIDGNRAKIYGWGDSRVYGIKKDSAFNKHDSQVRLITADTNTATTTVCEMHPEFEWPLNDAQTEAYHEFTRTFHDAHFCTAPITEMEIELGEGDRLLLCTDGLWRFMRWDGFKEYLTLPISAWGILKGIFDLFSRNGIGDDTTGVLYEHRVKG